MKTTEIKTKAPFNSIFKIDVDLLNTIKEHMEEYGYDPAFPIVLWGDIVIDGHTRLQAAEMAGIEDVPVEQKDFKDELEALVYAIHNQRDRRNLSNDEIIRCVEALDERMEKGSHLKEYPRDSEGHITKPNKVASNFIGEPSAERTANIIGKGQSMVKDARTILDSGNEEIRREIESGEKSIKAAAKEIREEKKEQKQATSSTFNQQRTENIEWAKWSWNPVSGCKNGCLYCYARDIANRFYPWGFEPHFYQDRLRAPEDTKIPKDKEGESGWKNVFVCSMADLFGDWVTDNWIKKILFVIENNPQWIYIFLTKNPKRYLEFKFPDYAWLGATADTQERSDIALDIFKDLKHPIKFLSCEPLMEEIKLSHPNSISWLIIGGRSKSSGMEAGQPEWKWVEKLLIQASENSIKVYFKPNLTVVPKEYPDTVGNIKVLGEKKI